MTKYKVFRRSDEVNWGKLRGKGASVIWEKSIAAKIVPFPIWKCQVTQFGLNYIVHVSLEFAHKALKCKENSGTFCSSA